MGADGTLRAVVKELRTSWGLSLRKAVLNYWPENATKPRQPPPTASWAVSWAQAFVSVPSFCFFSEILTDPLGVGSVSCLRIRRRVIERSKGSDEWEPAWAGVRDSREPPAAPRPCWFADPFPGLSSSCSFFPVNQACQSGPGGTW